MDNVKKTQDFERCTDFKIYIGCNACKRRELDSLLVKKYLLVNNYSVVDDLHTANVVIFFTCSFSEEMSTDSYRRIKYYQENFEFVFVCGCFPVIGMHELVSDSSIITIKNDSLREIENYFPPRVLAFDKVKDGNEIYYDSTFDGNVFLIRISSGCYGNCSYCAIKKVIGGHKSKPLSSIIEEVEFAISHNCSYIRLVADDGGGYGIDMGLNIINLLERICKCKKIKGIDFEISPKWILKYREEFEKFIKENTRLKYKITIPIQSYSQEVLKHMGREFDVRDFKRVLINLKVNRDTDIFFVTHIITGYPIETLANQLETIDFLESHIFNQVNVFPFTLHPKSPIAQSYMKTDVDVQQRTDYFVRRLCDSGYVVLESSMSESNQWGHAILRLNS